MKIEHRKRLESLWGVEEFAFGPEIAAGRGIQMADNKDNKLIWKILPALFHIGILDKYEGTARNITIKKF